VTGTSNGCSATDAVLVTVLPAPTITPTSTTLCAGQSTTLTVASASTGTPCAANGLTGTLTTGLVGYWPFCGNANDATSNGNNGTVSGASLTTDRFGNANSAYNFNGTSNKIEVNATTAFNVSQFTVSVWANTSSPSVQNLVSKSNWSNANSETFGTGMDASSIWVTVKKNSNCVAGAGWNSFTTPKPSNFNGNWHLYTFSYDGAFLKIYLNGVLTNSLPLSGPMDICNGGQLKMGTWWSGDTKYFNGKLDDIGFWNRPLTNSEVTQLYNQGQATYSWSPGGETTPSITVSPTATTTYVCTISQGGATTTQSQTITVNPLPTVNAGVDQTVFASSSVTLSGSGATSYTWNNGVTNNTAFTATTTSPYTVTGTSNGCSATDAVLVTVLPAPTITPTSSTICAGQSTTLTAASASTGTPCAANGLTGTLTTGLVGYWPFCGNANDASGNGNNGTVNGASLTTDRFGNVNSAYSFNGSSNNIRVPNSQTLNNSSVSISGWFNTGNLPIDDGLSAKGIIGKWWQSPSSCNSNYNAYLLCLTKPSGQSLSYLGAATDFYAGNNFYTTTNITTNNWFHFVFSHNSTTGGQLFINGQLINSNNVSGSICNSINDLIFGADVTNGALYRFFNGKLDDIGIWNRVLTAAEILQLYTQGQATYSWSPGGATTPSITVSPTATTTYTCTITQGGATTTKNQTITVNPLPTVNAGVDQTVFAGNQVTLSGSGATTYAWDNGVTNNTPFTANTTTTYTVTGTSNGCSANDAVLVTVLPTPTITPTSATLCAGQSTTLTAASTSQGTPCAANGLTGTLTTGLVGYWPFCGNANDASGNGNNGTVNGPILTTDRFGNANSAYDFNGTTNFVSLNNTANVNFLQGVTFSAWMRSSDIRMASIVDKETYPTASGYRLNIRDNSQLWAEHGQYGTPLAGANTAAAPGGYSINTWVFVVGTLNPITNLNSIYINGVLVNSVSISTLISNNKIIEVGKSTLVQGEYFKGKLDDIGIWNRALNATEIQQLYNFGLTTYSWSPGGATTPSITVSPTATTIYTCTIAQNGATTTQSQTITVNPIPTVNAGVDQTVFAGNQVTLSGSGATTYAWNNGVTNNTAFTATTTSTYTVTGTSNGCSATDAVLVTVLPAPTITPTSATICAGQSSTLTVASASTGTPCAANGLTGTLTTGLVGYWPFCGNANDASGNGNNGTVNGPMLTTDRFGNANSAFDFNGTSYIQINPNLGNFQTGNFTLSCWVYDQDAVNGGVIISKRNAPSNGSFFTMGWVNSPAYEINQSTSIDHFSYGYAQSFLNAWHCYTFTRTGNSIKIYLNGNLINTSTTSIVHNISNLANLTFGARYNGSQVGEFFLGKIDDIGIWNRTLTTTEIQQLYNQGQATYSWSPGGATTPSITVSPTATTTYTVTITQNGATTTQSQTITVNPLPTVNAGVDQTVFAGAQVTLAGSGATSYAWNNGVTNNTAFTANTTTTYTVTGTSNACSATDAVLVTVLPAPTITPTSATICAGQTASLTVSSPSAISTCNPFSGGLATNLVGYWPFCGNANDASANGNHGTVTGATLSTDRFGNSNSAYLFSPNTNDIILTPIGVNLNPPFSYSMWVLTSTAITYDGESNACINASSYGMMSNNQNWAMNPHHGGNTTLGVGLSVGTNSIQSAEHASYVLESRMTHTGSFANQYQHIVVVYRSDSSFLYVNGIKVRGRPLACLSTPKVLPSNIYLGGQYNSPNFTGKIDDFGVWNKALSASEIAQLYNFIPTTYLWSNGATTSAINVNPTSTTTYTCVITQGNISTTVSQTITVNPTPSVNAGVDQSVFAGTQVTLAGSGATTYAWNNSVTNNTPFTATTTTTYTVTGTSNACSATDAVLVTVLPAPSLTTTNTTLCAGQSTTLTVASVSTGTPCASNGLTGTLTTGLVGYWPFCGNANDASGNGNNGTVNGPILTTDRFGNANSAYSFDGVNDLISTPRAHLGTFSTSAWIQASNTTCNKPILDAYNGSWELYSDCQNGQLSFIMWNNLGYTYYSTNFNLNVNTWIHVACVYTSSQIKVYVNGVLITTQTTTPVLPISGTLNIGASISGSPQYFAGKLDDIGIWNRALTANEIQQLYTQGQATYSWSPGGATTPSITVSPTATTTYTCTITQNGATTTQSQTITVNPLPTVNAGVDQTVFAGTQVTLAGSGATTYAWDNGVTNNTPFNATTTTTYTVTGTSNGCSSTDQVLVTVLPTPTITPTSATLCAGQSSTLTVASASTGTPCASTGLPSSLTTGLLGYWPFCGNANDASGNGRNGIVNGATLTTDRFGNANSAYNFTGTTNNITIPNSQSLVSGSFSVSSWCTIDELMPSNYDATIIGQLNGMVANDRKWLFGYRSIANQRGVSYYLFNNSGSMLANNYTINWQPTQSQWYHISWVFESGNTIKTYVDGVLHSSVQVNISTFNNAANNVLLKFGNAIDVDTPLPLPWNGKLDDIAIWNRPITATEIQQLYTQGQATYSWSPGGATTPSITVSPTSTTTYTCTITQNGATTTQSQSITVNPLPTVNAGVDQTVFAGTQVTLAGSGATTYAWNNGVTNNTPFSATTTTTYTLTGTSNGCSAEDAVLVTVLPTPTITPTSATLCAGQSTTLTVASASTGTPCASTGLSSSLTNGLVGYWPFCGNANDISGNGNNGTVNGATLTTDRFGNASSAYSFDGNDLISVNIQIAFYLIKKPLQFRIGFLLPIGQHSLKVISLVNKRTLELIKLDFTVTSLIKMRFHLDIKMVYPTHKAT
jgi:hypothetical protein